MLEVIIFLVTCAVGAPAPQYVTVWQTTTQIMNDKSVAIDSGSLTPSSTNAIAFSRSTTSLLSTSSSGNDSGDFNYSSGGFKSWIENILSRFEGLRHVLTTEGPSEVLHSTSQTMTTLAANLYHAVASNTTPNKATPSSLSSSLWRTYYPDSSTTSSSTILAEEEPVRSSSSEYATASSSSSSDIYAAIDESSGIDKSFAKLMLDSHNAYRAEHSAGPLTWDKEAYTYAKKVADDYDCSGVLTHTHGGFGENLACGYKSGTAALKAWYDEGETYDYTAANSYDHFTQVVWKSTTKLGCAYKDCRYNNWGLYVVCEYSPVGNVVGKSLENVLP